MTRFRKWGRRVSLSATMAIVAIMAAVPAMAQEDPLGDAISGAASDVQSQITSVLPEVLAVAAFLLVINVAWRFFRRFVRS